MSRRVAAGLLLGLAMAGVAPRARADVLQAYVFQNGQTYVVRTALGITTQVELIADDEVQDFSVGFSGGWDVGRRGNVLYLRPRNVDVDTNLIVRTRARIYILDLKVVASNWKRLDEVKAAGVQYRVVFRDGRAAGTTGGARVAETGPSATAQSTAPAIVPPLVEGFDPGKRWHFGYDVAASPDATPLVPKHAYDDGTFTYFMLDREADVQTRNLGAVFARLHPNGKDMTVNSHMAGNTLVVHGVYPILVIRRDRSTVMLRRRGTP